MSRVLVCDVQVPFVHGGAEILVRELVRQLGAAGHVADMVSVPFKWYPKEEILGHAAAWRLLDLSESNGQPVDVAIATKFPSYFVRHHHKVTWLVHQYRAAYELCGTPYSDFEHVETVAVIEPHVYHRESGRLFLDQLQPFRNALRHAYLKAARFQGTAKSLQKGPVVVDDLGGPQDDILSDRGKQIFQLESVGIFFCDQELGHGTTSRSIIV